MREGGGSPVQNPVAIGGGLETVLWQKAGSRETALTGGYCFFFEKDLASMVYFLSFWWKFCQAIPAIFDACVMLPLVLVRTSLM